MNSTNQECNERGEFCNKTAGSMKIHKQTQVFFISALCLTDSVCS